MTIAIIGVLFLINRLKPREEPIPVFGQVGEFTLTNQLGEAVSSSMLRGKVWLANIIFTRCAGPCSEMTLRMSQIQSALSSEADVRFVSLTTDPEHDTPGVLREYGERFGADSKRWWFLTGTKEQIVQAAIDQLKLTSLEVKPEERKNPQDLFVHSTITVVIDQQGQLRGIIDAMEEGSLEKTLGIVRRLRKEEK